MLRYYCYAKIKYACLDANANPEISDGRATTSRAIRRRNVITYKSLGDAHACTHTCMHTHMHAHTRTHRAVMYAPRPCVLWVCWNAPCSARISLHSITVAHKLLEESKLAWAVRAAHAPCFLYLSLSPSPSPLPSLHAILFLSFFCLSSSLRAHGQRVVVVLWDWTLNSRLVSALSYVWSG